MRITGWITNRNEEMPPTHTNGRITVALKVFTSAIIATVTTSDERIHVTGVACISMNATDATAKTPAHAHLPMRGMPPYRATSSPAEKVSPATKKL